MIVGRSRGFSHAHLAEIGSEAVAGDPVRFAYDVTMCRLGMSKLLRHWSAKPWCEGLRAPKARCGASAFTHGVSLLSGSIRLVPRELMGVFSTASACERWRVRRSVESRLFMAVAVTTSDHGAATRLHDEIKSSLLDDPIQLSLVACGALDLATPGVFGGLNLGNIGGLLTLCCSRAGLEDSQV